MDDHRAASNGQKATRCPGDPAGSDDPAHTNGTCQPEQPRAEYYVFIRHRTDDETAADRMAATAARPRRR